jgi:hypothetical protein
MWAMIAFCVAAAGLAAKLVYSHCAYGSTTSAVTDAPWLLVMTLTGALCGTATEAYRAGMARARKEAGAGASSTQP